MSMNNQYIHFHSCTSAFLTPVIRLQVLIFRISRYGQLTAIKQEGTGNAIKRPIEPSQSFEPHKPGIHHTSIINVYIINDQGQGVK
jgi:hypothetical protein